MAENNKRYWKGIEEYKNDTEFVKNAEREFPEFPDMDSDEGPNRRDFLKLMGFSIAAASLAACEAPVKKAIPYLNKPVDIDPTIPNYYASTYFQEGEYCSILVKTREGRPIKIEGNTLSPISQGGTSASVQGSVLDLYDGTRYKGFLKKGEKLAKKEEDILAQNDAIDKEIIGKLKAARNIRIVSPSIISPSTKAVVAEFKQKYPGTEHVTYDVFSASGILEANQKSFGKGVVPTYNFEKANVIVSFAADFLGTWLSPIEFARQYGKNRKLNKDKKEMSRHFQFESQLSLTGANADYRIPVKPSQLGAVLASLYKKLTGSDKFAEANIDKALDKAAAELKANKGKSLVVSGSNDADVQIIVNAINHELNSYGSTINLDQAFYCYQGKDKDINDFIDDVKGNGVDAIIFYGTNPVYTHPRGKELKDALTKSKATKISLAYQPDETSELCDYICPDNHYLESWNDSEPRQGFFSLTQPTITNIYKTRQAQDSFLTWSENSTTFYDYLVKHWQTKIYPMAGGKFSSPLELWRISLHDGVFAASVKAAAPTVEEDTEGEDTPQAATSGFQGNVSASISAVTGKKASGIELTTYQKVSIRSGASANNPWLQEMPDPISKACWDNYLCISQSMAEEMEVAQNDLVTVSADGFSFEIPVLIQPGQAKGTVAIAVGYGKTVSGDVGKEIGIDVYPLTGKDFVSGVTVAKASGRVRIAQTQTHHTIMGRPVIQEATLAEYKEDPGAGRYHPHVITSDGQVKKPTDITLWEGHTFPNHSWGMAIDLNSCIGCNACSIACQAENNVPVVGKKEILMRREMHWIRIDRYYSSDAEEGDLGGMEKAAENPEVTFMPMMCQHCSTAPCETVCPVLATTHSTEGLNQMTYNRCIGTRYCANNCPYKVRRFNWFHYAQDTRFTDINYSQTSDLGRMVLNPDVTVRSRGVMEKCSMCVQRIQAGKLEAKKEKRRPKDGEIMVACAQACPTEAITFGDMLNQDSKIAKALAIESKAIEEEKGMAGKQLYKITEPRAYHVLEEINVQPQISYLTKIRNIDREQSKGETTESAES